MRRNLTTVDETFLTQRPLEGLRICFLGSNYISNDTRAYREALALANAGAKVTVVNAGSELNQELESAPFQIVLTDSHTPPQFPLLAQFETMRIIGRVLTWRPWCVLLACYKQRKMRAWQKDRDEMIWKDLENAAVQVGADIVHATNLYSAVPAMNAAKRLNAKLVYDSYELWTSVINDPLRRDLFPESMQDKLLSREKAIVQMASKTIVVGESIAEKIAIQYDAEKPLVLYNGPLAVSAGIKRSGSQISMLIQGDYQKCINVENCLRALALLDERYSLTLQGRAMEQESIAEIIEDLDLSSRVHFAPLVPLGQTVNFASQHDIGLFAGLVHHDGFTDLNIKYSNPNRFFTYLAAGLAIGITDLVDLKAIVTRADAGVVFKSPDPEGIAEGILRLGEDKDALDRYKTNALAASHEYLWSVQSKKLVSLYESLRSKVDNG